MAINANAPVISVGEVRVQAPPSVVWTVMSTIGEWPRWNPEISTAELDGPLAPGSTFRWRAGPGTITSVLREVRPGELLEWTGRTFGVRAIHAWHVRADDDGTIVKTEESLGGTPAHGSSGDGARERSTRRSPAASPSSRRRPSGRPPWRPAEVAQANLALRFCLELAGIVGRRLLGLSRGNRSREVAARHRRPGDPDRVLVARHRPGCRRADPASGPRGRRKHRPARGGRSALRRRRAACGAGLCGSRHPEHRADAGPGRLSGHPIPVIRRGPAERPTRPPCTGRRPARPTLSSSAISALVDGLEREGRLAGQALPQSGGQRLGQVRPGVHGQQVEAHVLRRRLHEGEPVMRLRAGAAQRRNPVDRRRLEPVPVRLQDPLEPRLDGGEVPAPAISTPPACGSRPRSWPD